MTQLIIALIFLIHSRPFAVNFYTHHLVSILVSIFQKTELIKLDCDGLAHFIKGYEKSPQICLNTEIVDDEYCTKLQSNDTDVWFEAPDQYENTITFTRIHFDAYGKIFDIFNHPGKVKENYSIRHELFVLLILLLSISYTECLLYTVQCKYTIRFYYQGRRVVAE